MPRAVLSLSHPLSHTHHNTLSLSLPCPPSLHLPPSFFFLFRCPDCLGMTHCNINEGEDRCPRGLPCFLIDFTAQQTWHELTIITGRVTITREMCRRNKTSSIRPQGSLPRVCIHLWLCVCVCVCVCVRALPATPRSDYKLRPCLQTD